jgi:hypothetical protein
MFFMSRRSKLKKLLRETIVQGQNNEILDLFKDIVKVSSEEFREDNLPTITGFLTENLYRALIINYSEISNDEKIIRDVMISEINELYGLKNHESF